MTFLFSLTQSTFTLRHLAERFQIPCMYTCITICIFLFRKICLIYQKDRCLLHLSIFVLEKYLVDSGILCSKKRSAKNVLRRLEISAEKNITGLLRISTAREIEMSLKSYERDKPVERPNIEILRELSAKEETHREDNAKVFPGDYCVVG